MAFVRHLIGFACVCLLAVAATDAEGRTARVRLKLPYDLAARGSTVYVADGTRHQILAFDLRRRRLRVVAGTGRIGTSGDGGRATRARLTEPVELAVDGGGNVYFSDVHEGRVRRIDRSGVITTVARVPAAAGLALDPTGRYLAMASIEGWVYRLQLAGGTIERLAGDGTAATSGDGGPASAAQVNGPHDVTYDRDGDLLVTEAEGVRRIDAATRRIDRAFSLPAEKVVVGPDGTMFLLSGGPGGGRVTEVAPNGAVVRVIGTGTLSRHVARAPIGRVGFIPTDVEPVAGAVLISEAKPVAAVRRLAAGSKILTTLLR